MEKGFFHKNQIPADSTLLVKVSPAEPPPAPDLWDAILALSRRDGTNEATFSNGQLRAGIEHVLSGDSSRYSGPLVLTFAGASDARVEMEVQKPDGTRHGEAYDFVHSAAPADAISIRLRMA